MLGIILMAGGGLAIVLGFLIYRSDKNRDAQESQSRDLNHIIQMTIADGVITEKEKILITDICLEKGLVPDEVLKNIQRQLNAIKEIPETEIIDPNKRKGDDFEKYVVQKFDQQYFTLLEWTSDKFVEGTFSLSNMNPDLTWEFRLNDIRHMFAVECKWRADFNHGQVEVCSEDQLQRYKKHSQVKGYPVFLVLGINGKPSAPEYLYVIPIDKLDQSNLNAAFLESFGKNREKDFFYDFRKKSLK